MSSTCPFLTGGRCQSPHTHVHVPPTLLTSPSHHSHHIPWPLLTPLPNTLQVVEFLDSPEYAHFDRIIFDTAPTGHTLRLLTLPDFLDKGLGKLVMLRARLGSAAGAVKNFFTGGKAEKDPAVVAMENLRVSWGKGGWWW